LLIKKLTPSLLTPHITRKTPLSEPLEKLQVKFTEDPGNTITVFPRYLEVNWSWLAAKESIEEL